MPIRSASVPWQRDYNFGVGVDQLSTSPMALVVNDVHSAVAEAGGAIVGFQVQRIRTTSELEQALGIDVSASYGSAAFGAGIDARFQFARSAQVQTSSLFMTVTATINLKFLSIGDPALTADAASLVERPDVFEQRFGNMFVRGIARGGVFVGVLRVETESQQTSEDIATELSGSYGLFSADAKVKFESVQKKFRASSFVSMHHEGGPIDMAINDVTDPMELLRNANLFLKAFQERPDDVAIPYEVTLAPITIARGPMPLNSEDIEHAQDVLAFCAKRRSALLDQLNGLQYILDNPGRFDFSNGAQVEAVRKANEATQGDLDLIAACASATINRPRGALLPADFAKARGGVFPLAVMPSPLPVAKAAPPAAPDAPPVPPVGAALNLTLDGILLWGGWRGAADLATMSDDDKRNTIIVEATNCTLVPEPFFYQRYDNPALIAKAAIVLFLIRVGIRRVTDMKLMSVDDHRNTLIVENHNHAGLAIPTLQGMGDAELVHLGATWAPPTAFAINQPHTSAQGEPA